MPKVFTSKSQAKGELGEEIACKYLISKGYTVLERNFTILQGEIDIVAKEGNQIVFLEVKSAFCLICTRDKHGTLDFNVPHETRNQHNTDSVDNIDENVPHETEKGVTRGTISNNILSRIGSLNGSNPKGHSLDIRPEDNMHPRKLQKLYKTIEIYMSDKDVFNNKDWRIDLLCVFIDIHSKKTKVSHYKNVNI